MGPTVRNQGSRSYTRPELILFFLTRARGPSITSGAISAGQSGALRSTRRPNERSECVEHLVCAYTLLAKKACIFIAIYQTQKLRQRFNLGVWVVPMPLEIGSLPIHFPDLLRFYVRRFCYRLFDFLFRIIPKRTNLEYLDALTFDPKSKVQLRTNMGKRTSLFDERPHFLLNLFSFELAQSHLLHTMRAVRGSGEAEWRFQET